MPCRSDYLEPTSKEIYCRKTANLLEYVLSRTGSIVTQSLVDSTKDIYCNIDYTKELCETLQALDKHTFNELVYNARLKISRELADWWEEHQEKDRQRETQEAKQKGKEEVKARALSKLTPEERKALGHE